MESRGFIFTGTLSYLLNIPFVLIRKKNKLPGKCNNVRYSLHYGEDTLEIQQDSIQPGKKVILIDDAVATGGKFFKTILHTVVVNTTLLKYLNHI